MKILCLVQVAFIQMPENDGIRITMRQFYSHESLVSIHLSGQGDAGIHGWINELHGMHGVFSATRLEWGKWLIFRVMLFVVPLPYRRKGEPGLPDSGFCIVRKLYWMCRGPFAM